MQRGHILQQVGTARTQDDAAAVEHQRVVGHAQHHLRMLLHDDGCQAFFARDAANRSEQLLHDDRCETFERFVKQQQSRIESQRASEGQHLLFAARQLCAEVATPFGQSGKQLENPGWRPGAGACHRGQVLKYRERFEDIALLRHPADTGRCPLVGGQ